VLTTRLASSSLHSYCAALKQYLRFVGRGEDADRLPSFSCVWTPPEPPTPEQIDKVLESATLTERALILAFYSTSARSAELLGNRSTRSWAGGSGAGSACTSGAKDSAGEGEGVEVEK